MTFEESFIALQRGEQAAHERELRSHTHAAGLLSILVEQGNPPTLETNLAVGAVAMRLADIDMVTDPEESRALTRRLVVDVAAWGDMPHGALTQYRHIPPLTPDEALEVLKAMPEIALQKEGKARARLDVDNALRVHFPNIEHTAEVFSICALLGNHLYELRGFPGEEQQIIAQDMIEGLHTAIDQLALDPKLKQLVGFLLAPRAL